MPCPTGQCKKGAVCPVCLGLVPPVDETQLAYLAGLIDGEAYIGVKKSRRPDAVSPIYHERIQVRMVHEGAIRLLSETLGGSYYSEKPHANNGRPLFCWQASDALAANILRQLLPYLIVKKESAENVLLLRESKQDPMARLRGPGRRMAPEILATRDALYVRGKELNRVGVAEGGEA